MTDSRRSLLGTCAALWGVVGMSAVLLFAIWRLGWITMAAFDEEMTAWHWLILLAGVVFMAYSEGYRGFQKSFSPRSAARAYYLYRNPSVLGAALAPFFCAAYFGAAARTVRVIWIGTLLIVVLVVIVHRLPQPWRGIIDAGVVVGLTWGVLSFWYFVARAFLDDDYPWPPGVPDGPGR